MAVAYQRPNICGSSRARILASWLDDFGQFLYAAGHGMLLSCSCCSVHRQDIADCHRLATSSSADHHQVQVEIEVEVVVLASAGSPRRDPLQHPGPKPRDALSFTTGTPQQLKFHENHDCQSAGSRRRDAFHLAITRLTSRTAALKEEQPDNNSGHTTTTTSTFTASRTPEERGGASKP